MSVRRQLKIVSLTLTPAPLHPMMAASRAAAGGSLEKIGDGALTYRWDAAAQRYTPDSDAFTHLARENEERF